LAVLAALSLVFLNLGLTANADEVTYAEVTGHAASSDGSNQADFWDEEGLPACYKIEDRSVADQQSYLLSQDFRLVVVKSANEAALEGPYSNTLFEGASAGETVWADTNGNSTFDPGGDGGDKEISHIIFCPAADGFLTLVKQVDNGETGATTTADAWTLEAAGPTTISGASGAEAVTGALVQAGTYVLSETGPNGYEPSAWECVLEPDEPDETDLQPATYAVEAENGTPEGDTVMVGPGEHWTCTVTNTAIPPTLTLVKKLSGAEGPATLDDFTLTATGATTISGASGESDVTAVPVPIGDYTLTEQTELDNYEPLGWVCEGAELDSETDTVSLGLGDEVTCTVTNEYLPPDIDLIKADGVCINDLPYLDWSVTVDNIVPTQFTLQWVTVAGNEAGDPAGIKVGDPIVVPVADVDFDGVDTYSGRVLWLGASEDPLDWPGWVLENGVWVADPTDFGGNLRTGAALEVTVNPTDQRETFYPTRSDEGTCDPQNAGLALVKQVINDDARPDGPKGPLDFELTATNKADPSIVYEGPSAGPAGAGTYTLSETSVDGWTLTGWQCVTGDAALSVLHGIPGATVDVWVNGALTLDDFTPGSLEGPIPLPPDAYDVVVTGPSAADAASDVILGPLELGLGAGMSYTVVAHLDASGAPTASVYVDDTFPAASGEGKVTVRHTAAAPTVDVVANGTLALGSFSNTQQLGAFSLPGGTEISAQVKAAGTVVPTTPAGDLTVTADVNTIVYAWGEADDLRLAVQSVPLVAPVGESDGTVTLAAGEYKTCVAVNDDVAIPVPPPAPELPKTGADVARLGVMSAGLIAAGLALMAVARRRFGLAVHE
jgi:hypothetical protein